MPGGLHAKLCHAFLITGIIITYVYKAQQEVIVVTACAVNIGLTNYMYMTTTNGHNS